MKPQWAVVAVQLYAPVSAGLHVMQAAIIAKLVEVVWWRALSANSDLGVSIKFIGTLLNNFQVWMM